MKVGIVFVGTSEIAAFSLRKIINKFHVACVITKEDKLGDRNKLTYSPVKQVALKYNIPIYQPNKISNCYDELIMFKKCFLFVCSYGQIIPKKILDIFIKSINLHGSILPKFRGASPIQNAIKCNEKKTGYSLIKMTNELDAGPIYVCHTFDLNSTDTYDSASEKMCSLIDVFLINDLQKIIFDNIQPIEQSTYNQDVPVTYTNLIKKENLFINWNSNANEIDSFVRSLYSKPLAKTRYGDIHLKILKTKVINEINNDSSVIPGTLLKISKEGILVKALHSCILITELQIPNKKPVQISQIINGKHIFKTGANFF